MVSVSEKTNLPASVLITGGTGFFGKGFARRLLEMGVPRVCILSRSEYQQHLMRQEIPDPRLRFFVGDVRDEDRLRRAMEGCDVVVHATALKRVEVGEYDAEEMAKTNVIGAMNVISAARDCHVERVIALSTDKAFEPVNAYGASKLLAEKLFLAANNASGAHGPRFSVTRYGNVAGSTGSVIPTWRAQMDANQPITIRHPDATRFWMTLAEAIDLVLFAMGEMPSEVVVPRLPAYRVGDLALAMRHLGKSAVSRVPCALGPGEKMHESMEAGKSSDKARRMSVQELKEALKHV